MIFFFLFLIFTLPLSLYVVIDDEDDEDDEDSLDDSEDVYGSGDLDDLDEELERKVQELKVRKCFYLLIYINN